MPKVVLDITVRNVPDYSWLKICGDGANLGSWNIAESQWKLKKVPKGKGKWRGQFKLQLADDFIEFKLCTEDPAGYVWEDLPENRYVRLENDQIATIEIHALWSDPNMDVIQTEEESEITQKSVHRHSSRVQPAVENGQKERDVMLEAQSKYSADFDGVEKAPVTHAKVDEWELDIKEFGSKESSQQKSELSKQSSEEIEKSQEEQQSGELKSTDWDIVKTHEQTSEETREAQETTESKKHKGKIESRSDKHQERFESQDQQKEEMRESQQYHGSESESLVEETLKTHPWEIARQQTWAVLNDMIQIRKMNMEVIEKWLQIRQLEKCFCCKQGINVGNYKECDHPACENCMLKSPGQCLACQKESSFREKKPLIAA